ncbi:MAG: Ribonuclease Y [candidate division CPR3 bacterium GW2011_GWF2_35_18]|uniref:Ribonuclease Y n=1 Tax=candidate division CPR3 bacterium GW2011_GWF2_35_18 TaxID=1618350 RepID=A0A0G0EQQ4_UNCC3|nr:MAG: Ribonuclease Y [candidate division CPR3 bacterium GW2011_GWF2_35_18]
MDPMYFLWGITILFSGGALSAVVVLLRQQSRRNVPLGASNESAAKSEEIIKEAQTHAKEIVVDAKDRAHQIKRQAEVESDKVRRDLADYERKIEQENTSLGKKLGALEERERFFKNQETKLNDKEKEIEEIKKRQLDKLQRVAVMTQDEARKIILDAVEKNLSDETSRRIKETEEEIKNKSEEKAREIIAQAIQAGGTDYVAEYTSSSVNIPDDEIKGRIIGREGRNIKAFEKASGVDVNIDETPGVIKLSSFNSLRREVARRAMEKLITDGRIQPSRIEEVVEKAQKEVDKIVHEAGEKLVYDVGVGGLPREVIDVLGRFKFRTSYGQNMVAHTMEVVNIGKVLATELGANVKIVKTACLLHDIGKVLQEDNEGSHVQIGVDFLKRFKIQDSVIHAVEAHHEDVTFKTVEAILVQVADAISGARPGARYEDFESYLKRVSDMENIATSFEGVDKAYAIQAGREVRVIAIPSKISDSGITKVAHDIANKIHSDIVYPGTVKVTVIRESRAVEVAK